MSNTKEITFYATSVSIFHGSRSIRITADEPNIENILTGVDKEDITPWIERNFEPEEIFPSKMLGDWAEANGYVKADSNG